MIMNKYHERIAGSGPGVFIIGKVGEEASDGREI
jgi:hypothetical protein